MEIKLAKKAGFCFGVRRAIEMAYDKLHESDGKPVYTLGPLVHNPQVIEQLEKDGIKSIEIDEMAAKPRGHLIIRTHGVSPKIWDKASELSYITTDATCPLVRKIHHIVIDLQKEGYPVIVIGHASHPEVQGIVGEVEDNCFVIEKAEDVAQLQMFKKLGIVVQTTALWSRFQEISAALLEKTQEARIFNTICHATIERQQAAEELAGQVDLMIIIGGKNSSNTGRLLEICKSVNPNAYHVEQPDELNPEWFRGVARTGLTAGASTPDYIIENVYSRIEEIAKELEENSQE
jgi:(E)-4-hydroxy-3-methyl-but-2-enyl pyrophosphate reductase